jgi:methionine synthase reductase
MELLQICHFHHLLVTIRLSYYIIFFNHYTTLEINFHHRTGDGDPPENAGKFWREMRNKKLPENYLSNMEYALLGLGDTNYTTFLGYPKSVERQLNKMGAKQFYKSGWADDAVGLEIVVDPWIEGLWPELTRQLREPHTHFVSIGEVITEKTASLPSTSQLEISDVLPEKLNPEVILKEDDVEKCLDGMASLNISVAPLSECDLKIPILPQPFLNLTFNSDLKVN